MTLPGLITRYQTGQFKGGFNIYKTLENLQRYLSPDKDQRAGQLKKIFGDMASPISLVLMKLKESERDYQDLRKNSANIVDRKYAEMAQHTSLKWKKLKSNLSLLSMSIGGPMLDAVNSVITPLTSLVVGVTNAATTFPNFTRVLFSALTTLAAFKVGKLAFGYTASLLGQAGNYARLARPYFGAGGAAVKEGSGWLSKFKPKWLEKTKLGKLTGKSLGGLGKAGSLISAATATPVYVTNFSDFGGAGSMLGELGGKEENFGKSAKNLGRMGRVGRFLGKFGKVAAPLALIGTGMDIASTVTNDNLTHHQKVKRISGDVGGLSGGAVGAIAGAAIGSIIPVVGTWIGGIAGSMIGGWLGNKAGKEVVDLYSPEKHIQDIAKSQVNNTHSQQNEVTINNHINQNINATNGQSAKEIGKQSSDELAKRIYAINPLFDAMSIGGQY